MVDCSHQIFHKRLGAPEFYAVLGLNKQTFFHILKPTACGLSRHRIISCGTIYTNKIKNYVCLSVRPSEDPVTRVTLALHRHIIPFGGLK